MTTTPAERIGGWLLAPLAWLLVALLSTSLALLLYATALLTPQSVTALGAQPLKQSILWFVSFASTIAIWCYTLWLVIAFFKRRRLVPKHYIIWLLVYVLLPLAFPQTETPKLLDLLQMVCKIYIIAVSLRFINASLNVVLEIYNRKESFKNKPLKGLIQMLQVGDYFVAVILIISVIIDKSAASLFAGLGASAAVLMLVFRDTLLGFVAGIQLSANDMLRPDDWITMEKYGANGRVIEVTLHAVKVRNFDNTITTIPPYALVSDAFQNWRGMFESGGRRIKRSINIDMNSVRFCTPEMLEQFRQIPLLTNYIETKKEEGRITNLGIFRAYLTNYLKSLPEVNTELICMVRQLQPTATGIPLELYFFTRVKEWLPYEAIQADIFDHVLAIVPEFGLRIFQHLSRNDWKPC